MNCPKCNNIIEENAQTCKYCGNILNEPQIEILEETPDFTTVFSSQESKYNDTDLLYAYIGKNATKIVGGKWSWATLFLSHIYFLYRKMWVLAIITFVVEWLLLLFLNVIGSIIILIGAIILAVFFKKMYCNHAQKMIAKIKKENQDKTEEEIYNLCVKKGGTSSFAVILYCIITFILIVGVIIAFYLLGWNSILKIIENSDIDINITTNDTNNNDSYFDEIVSSLKNDETYGSGMNFLDYYKNKSTITVNNNEITITYNDNSYNYTTIFTYNNGTVSYRFNGNKNSDTTSTQSMIDSSWIIQMIFIVGKINGYSETEIENWLEEYEGTNTNGITTTSFTYDSNGITTEGIETWSINIHDFNISSVSSPNTSDNPTTTQSGLYYQVPSGFTQDVDTETYKYYSYLTQTDDCTFSITKTQNYSYNTPLEYLENVVYIPENRISYSKTLTTIDNQSWGYLYYNTTANSEENYALIINDTIYHIRYKIYEDSGVCTSSKDNLISSLTFQ